MGSVQSPAAPVQPLLHLSLVPEQSRPSLPPACLPRVGAACSLGWGAPLGCLLKVTAACVYCLPGVPKAFPGAHEPPPP